METWEYIVKDSGARFLLVASPSIYERLKGLPDKLESLEHVYYIDGPYEGDSFAKLMELGRETPVDSIYPDSPEDTAGFIYTSGTTGNPKGVLLSHDNMCFNIQNIIGAGFVQPTDRSLAFLSWAHVFGQACELHAMFGIGASMGLIDDLSMIIDALGEVRPTLLFAVPRIFNKIYDGLNKRMADEPLVKQKLFEAALANSAKMRDEEQRGSVGFMTNVKDKFYDRVIFSKVRERFGGRLRIAVSGGAALSPDVARFIDNVKINVYEGYGLSETSPIISVNLPGARKIGSVGRPVDGVEVKITNVEGYPVGTGEICASGRNIMKGYHGLPEKTAEVIDGDGFFHTGDLGRIDEDGFVWILGRVKEQYKLGNGKYVVPAPVESCIALSGYILNVMIEGSNMPYNVAAIVIDQPAVTKWAVENGISTDNILESEKLKELITAEIAETTRNGKSYERPRKFILLDEEWTPDNGMLTPKMSLKRRVAMERFGDRLLALYDE